MRSSQSGADPLDPGPAGFAHRGLHSGTELPENSLAAFSAAIEFGAGIECDLRLTVDRHLVVFHDADASRLCQSPLRIGQSPWEDVRRLSVAGHPIPRLEDVLDLVDGRTSLLLELKVDRDLHDWGSALRRVLSGYHGCYGLMSFDPGLVRLLKSKMPSARRGLIIKEQRSLLGRLAGTAVARPDFLAVELGTLSRPWTMRERRTRPVYGWTVRTESERAQAVVQADALIWEANGRPRI